jgi:hypothetical protein
LGDWMCPRVFFLGSEHTKPAMTDLVRFSFFFAMFYICVNHDSNYVLVCGKPWSKLYLRVNHVPNYVSVCEMFFLFIEIKMQNKTKREYFNVWRRHLENTASERRLHTRHVRNTSRRLPNTRSASV